VSDPQTLAGRELVQRHPELTPDEVGEVERQAHGQGTMAERERREGVLDRFRHLLTDEQRGAANAVLSLDADAIAPFDDAKLRFILAGMSDPRLTPNLDAEARKAAREESQRYLDEIM
jgi:hypothetical protein